MKKLFFLLVFFPSLAQAQIFEMDALIRAVRGENGSQNISTHDLDAATDGIEIVRDQREAATLTRLCMGYYGRQAGDPTSHTFALQGVSTSTGRADGSTKSSGNASCTIDPPNNGTLDNTWQCCTMTSSYAATAGERLALNVTCAGCTGANYGRWSVAAGGEMKTGYPTGYTINGGVATRFARYPFGGWGSASEFYGTNATYNYTVTTAYSSGSTPDEIGLKFNRNDGCTSYVLGPITYMGRGPAAGTTATWTLYDTDGTTSLGTATIDGDIQGITPGGNDHYIFEFSLNASPTLTCGSSYRIAMTTPDAAANIQLMEISVGATDQSDLVFGTGASKTSRTDAGAWTDSSVARPVLSVSYSSVTFPSGGGSDSQFNKGFN